MPDAAFHHRPTLKQHNKAFKSKHSSKHALKDRAKGRVPRVSPKNASNASMLEAQRRINRRNAAKQTQLNKRQALVTATRIFSGVDGAPRIVTVVPLCEDVSAKEAVAILAASLGCDAENIPEQGLWSLRVDRFKTCIQFILLPYGSFYPTLDAAKVADYTLLLLSSSVEVSSWGDTLLRSLQAQGFSTTITAVAPSVSAPVLPSKEQAGVLKSLLSFIKYFIPTQSRIFNLESKANTSDALSAARALCEGKPADVRWRENRFYLVAESFECLPNEASDISTLCVTGFVRGSPLSADRLVHLPSYGDFKVSKITSAPPLRPTQRSVADPMELEPALLAERNSSTADSLVSTNQPDDLVNEQTWPTDDEMRVDGSGVAASDLPDASLGTTPKVVKRVPKGTSEYQAAWLIDDEEGEPSEEDDEQMSSVEGDAEIEADPSESHDLMESAEEMEDLVEEDKSAKKVTFHDLDVNEESKQLDSWRNRDREEADDASFPDEIDTPQDVEARVRFQRFRGLKSFRTSPWDPYENLPRDYARIFQFEDFKGFERSVFRRAQQDENAVKPGTRVTIHITDVPTQVSETFKNRGVLTVFGLLQHEHKMSVQNFKVQRDTEYDETVRSKDPLVLCIGPRRLKVDPIYSQHTRGGGKGVNNVHKFERFLRHGAATIATVFAPICFGKQPCLLLRETNDAHAPKLVATGTFMNPDTTRIIAKRIVLTGHPFKVHKRTATVRYMFFNPDDIMYFAPVQLHTKYGRTGHIRESLGTHGYFKAHFDGPINQMDTVCMSLYKRVYPKWAELWKEQAATDRSGLDTMDE